MKISFVIPCRNNLVYFEWAYAAIRKNQGDHEVFICAADDASTDGTLNVFKNLKKIDSRFDYIVNEGPDRVGHTILYDRIINEIVQTEVAIIFHADMYLCPGAIDEIQKLMYTVGGNIPLSYTSFEDGGGRVEYGQEVFPNYKTIVSLTRIEPPLHPPGPEKILLDCGIEPENFDEEKVLTAVGNYQAYPELCFPELKGELTTNGIFAPWAFFVKDFKEIGGHDPLFKPQSKEDSDIFNRFKLNGCKFIQTWRGYVYHITCRGSRFNPTLTTPGTNSSEWENHNVKSTRNFIRKWGHFVKHTELMDPIIPPKYETTFVIYSTSYTQLELLEPWADYIVTDLSEGLVDTYIKKEQPNTVFDLRKKFIKKEEEQITLKNGIVVIINCTQFTNNEFNIIHNLSELVKHSNLTGNFKVDNLTIHINDLTSYENELIKIDSEYYKSKLL